MKLILSLFILFVYFADLNARSRYSLYTEYKLVHACIDKKTFGGVTRSLRDECIAIVLEIEKEHSEYNIKSLDKDGKLKKLF